MTARRSATETHIHLNLIPHVIARQINTQGEDVHRISVKWVCLHHYNITVRTKSLKRELKPRIVVPSGNNPVDINYLSRDGNSGGVT